MIATYRLQLRPGFGFDEARELLPYLRRLGISHLYLSPITDARRGSAHGYDVVDHNRIRDELGGPDGFWSLLKAARAAGLALILDFVPNHAGVGARNARWQDVLAYGPHSPYARHFDIDWEPLKPELRWKILLPFLEAPYGDVINRGGISLVYEEGRISAASGRNRFALSPPTYAEVLAAALSGRGDLDDAQAWQELEDAFRRLLPHERGKADALRHRLAALARQVDLREILGQVRGERLHAILERQFWRLAYWRTAASEINYRRFFDVNDLVALRAEQSEVFLDTHRLLSLIVSHQGVEGIRIDHIDGLFDPHGYLTRLRDLGVGRIWVEKILSHGETLPPGWPVEGTVGYEFLNDALRVLVWPGGEQPLGRVSTRFLREPLSYRDQVYHSRRLVMRTALSGDLSRLAYGLDRISEGDYHTRDFTLEALREALVEIVAAFTRYRTYLPHGREDAEHVIQEVIHEARRRDLGAEPTVYPFVARVLLGQVSPHLREPAAAWAGRFQQYTAQVAAKGVEDTAFYRHAHLVGLNEVGGEPDRFSLAPQAFHARARFRALRYPRNLLATATHDHKRGEDVRMRLIVLAELPDAWWRTLRLLSRTARRYRSRHGPSRSDELLFYQTLAALWEGTDRLTLPDRLAAYMQKAAREAKLSTSWIDPDPEYEAALERFVRGVTGDPRTARAMEPLARALAHHGFTNGLTQLVLKLTSPGVPDFYQDCELADLSLVDPDNRRAHPTLFFGSYRALEAEGQRADHLLAFARESGGGTLLVAVPRFPATLDRLGGWGDTKLALPAGLAGRAWVEVLTDLPLDPGGSLRPADLALPWAVLFSEDRSPAAPGPAGA